MPDPRRKRLERLERSPKAVSPDSLHSVLVAFGYELKRQKGSHRTYGKAGAYPLTVPYRRPHVKRVYVETVIARLRQELAEDAKGEQGKREEGD